MSIESNPKRVNRPDDSDNDQFYPKSNKRKFEGWPILWILIAIFLVSAFLWYTGIAFYLIRWIKS